jgi:quercetin dioxygenase-like cupin family protein
MEKPSATEAHASNYQVKNVEPVMIGTDVRARLFTLAPGNVIPWHSHSEAADHYFVLQGELTVSTRVPEEIRAVGVGHNYRIPPGRPHLIANRSTANCQFLLLQGVGRFDWVKAQE